MRWFSACLSLGMCGLLLAGCDRDRYEIEMKADGDALQRKVTCWRDSDDKQQSLPPETLDQIGKSYPKREKSGMKEVFTGRFSGATPEDVGGKGSFTRFTSPLGSAAAYVERFRGDDDLDGRFDRARRAADQLSDLIAGWLTAELGKEPGFDRLKTWLDGDLRKDLRNLSALSGTCQVVASVDKESAKEFFVRAAQYLAERGYFAPQDIPARFFRQSLEVAQASPAFSRPQDGRGR